MRTTVIKSLLLFCFTIALSISAKAEFENHRDYFAFRINLMEAQIYIVDQDLANPDLRPSEKRKLKSDKSRYVSRLAAIKAEKRQVERGEIPYTTTTELAVQIDYEGFPLGYIAPLCQSVPRMPVIREYASPNERETFQNILEEMRLAFPTIQSEGERFCDANRYRECRESVISTKLKRVSRGYGNDCVLSLTLTVWVN